VYLGAILFFCLGAMLASSGEQLSLSSLRRFGPATLRFVYPALITLLGIVFLFLTLRQYGSNQNFQQTAQAATQGGKDLNTLLADLDKSIATSPDNPTYTLAKVDWLSQAYKQTRDKSYLTQVQTLLAELKTHESYSRNLILSQYRNYKELGEYNKTTDTLEEGIRKFQWDINFYEAAIMEYTESGLRSRQTNPAEAETSWNRAIELYNEILSRQAQLKNLPKEQLQGRSFDLTILIRQAIGQIYYYRGQYQDAIDILKPGIAGDLNPNPAAPQDTTYQYVRSAVFFYVASLERIGQSDEELRNKLITADPNTAALLEGLQRN
jgi:tetratricopeptide (TPR) repeat protein